MSSLLFPPPTETQLTEQLGNEILWAAIAEATRVHRTQKTKLGAGWYIAHPLHLVTIHLQCGFRVYEPDDLAVLIADTHHDGPEDRPRETSFGRIESMFGRRVRQLVEAVTLDPENPDKRGDREKLLRYGWQEQSVKMADVAANSLRVVEGVRSFGIAEVQSMLKQPLADRHAMELSFVTRCLQSGHDGLAPDHAHSTRQFTLNAIGAMGRAIGLT